MVNKDEIMQSPEFQELLSMAQEQLDRARPDLSEQIESLNTERIRLSEVCRGWRMSLGNPNLSEDVRFALEEDLSEVTARINDIKQRVCELDSTRTQSETAIDPQAVAERLEHLAELLEGESASAINVALSQHISCIECDPSGQIRVRMCLLGALANTEELTQSLQDQVSDLFVDSSSDVASSKVRGRRRTRRNIGTAYGDDDVADAANDFAVDQYRFSGLGKQWFTEDIIHIPERLSWSASNAREVAEYRLQHKTTMQKTADFFNKTIPTIRAALSYAKENYGLDAFGKSISESTKVMWSRDHALEVAHFFRRPGASMKKAEAIFGKSQPTLSKAKRLAAEMESHSMIATDSEI